MGSIINSDLSQIDQLKKDRKTIVLAGGSFDILHAGHIEFLKRAKKLGDALIVLLEPDSKIRKLKGENRPINSQKDRAVVLSNLPFVSFVYLLNDLKSDHDYEYLVKRLKPDIIATSGTDRVFEWEKNLEKEGDLKVVKVMERKKSHSTTKLVGKISKI